ncbi:protein of unknown function [Hyphomicrobium sp. MC1]|nr:protein of unknown function [Hyphomicrobium sp. MC1]
MQTISENRHLKIGGLVFPNLDQCDFTGPPDLLTIRSTSSSVILATKRAPPLCPLPDICRSLGWYQSSGVALSKDVPSSIQEHAHISPVWYTPWIACKEIAG